MTSQLSGNISGPNKVVATGLPPRHKIIVAIDYGTTFSGIIFGLSTMKTADELRFVPLFSDHQTEIVRVPTRFAYARENTSLPLDKWGFAVGPKETSCSWTKLLLDKNAVFGEEDDIISKIIIDEGMMHLPSHRNCKGVCEDFLHELYVAFAGYAERALGADAFRTSPIDCWISLPAIWSDEAKHATLSAARKAGFAKNPMDQIHTIAEPEAAAIATLKELAAPETLNAVQRGDNVLALSWTRNGIYFTANEQLNIVIIGGKCGSTYIDRHLHALLSDRFGNAFDSIPYSRKGPGSALMNNWEGLKKRFCPTMENAGTFELGPLYLDLPSSHQYDREENITFLSHEDMKSVFNPIVDRIINLVQKQVDQAKRQRKAKIHLLWVEWEFRSISTADYRRSVLQMEKSSFYALSAREYLDAPGGSTHLICKNSDLAVLRGAGIRALEELAPCTKYVRRHYGFRISRVFREFIDEEKHAYIDDYSNLKFCAGRAIWCVSKGDVITEGSFHSEGCSSPYSPGKAIKSTIELYSCEGDQQPDRMDDPRVKSVGKIRYSFPADFNFGMDSRSRFNQRLDKMVHEFHFQIQVVFGDRGANLKFRLAVGGRLVSDTTIEFPDH
ncbi:hypothetical protein BTUL_0076g00060 [Botrytis tulipae]|uniref:Uncharacterized protein n=1 Tax=Botrytis tulipae TaxID=87230 RepID=A0A4Z1EL26_9HELO|nr:hypothetical protein BTUL_0076g00060 [Botrytis tulipae]